MKKYLLLFILVSGYAFSQGVNDYQYVIVPAKFDFLKKEDQYRLNSLTKLMLQKYGFKAYLSNEEIPLNLDQRCSFMYADVVDNSGIIMTKVKIILKDCRDKVLFETEYGGSRDKEYAAAYNEALRAAGKSFDKLEYSYNSKSMDTTKEPLVETQVEPAAPYKTTVNTPTVVNDSSEVFYFAQPNATGFQVIDNEPKVIMRLFTTSVKDVFIATRDAKSGVVISKNGQWFFEYYENGKLVSEALKLKF